MSYFLHNNPFRGIVVPYDDGGGDIVINPVSVVINETINNLNVGDTGRLTATVSYSDDSQVNSSDTPNVVNWSSSDESILVIDGNGNYTALDVGELTITATSSDPEISSSVTLSVSEDFDFILTLGSRGGTEAFRVGFEMGSFGDIEGSYPDGVNINKCEISSTFAEDPSYYNSDYINLSAEENSAFWNGWLHIYLTFTFDDGAKYQTPEMGGYGSDLYYWYRTDMHDLLPFANEMLARVGQTAKVKVLESAATKDNPKPDMPSAILLRENKTLE
ncbi:Ig-like domain-containing protein [Vibrio harveyi]|uniref:Ig-like domain-containing protein n=1 Tax=Vibrio harveyi TaxID=669 RepID=UPI003CEAFB4E